MKDILDKILNIVGPSGLITGDDLQNRAGDWMGKTSCEAAAIIRPTSTEEVSAVIKLCNDAGQSVIAAGGLTGLVHATDANPDEIILSLERMKNIQNIDPVGRTITVEAGSQLQKVQEHAQENGLLFAIDLGARGSATIGGNIATNAGGNQVLRYGMMREQVLGLEVVLADGTIISSMNSLLKNNTGYDLKQLFIGAEGTLGIVTRAVLRLHPLPKSQSTALVALDSFDAVVEFFQFIGNRLGADLTAFEVMWKEHYELIAVNSGRHTPPIEGGASFYVVVEAAGIAPERDDEHFMEVLGQAIENELILDATIAASKAQRSAIWDIREDIEGLMHALAPVAVFDVSLPISTMQSYTENLRATVSNKWGDDAQTIIFGHLGDGNLHIGIAPRPWNDESHCQVEELVYGPLAKLGGSVSAEHGIGLEKKPWLHISRSEEELGIMRLLKSSLDPKNILNPGKVLTL